METMVATVLIVIIFMMTSMVLNSLFSNSLQQNNNITERLYQLQYQYQHKIFSVPYSEDFEGWEVSVSQEANNGVEYVLFKAINIQSKKTLVNHIIHED